MTSYRHYIPILKCKGGDLWALEHLKDASKEKVTPLIEPMPPKSGASAQDKVADAATKIGRKWASRPFFADLVWLENADPLANGKHVATEFFEKCSAKELKPIPVTSPDRKPIFQEAVFGAADPYGLMLRLLPRHFNDETALARAIDATMTRSGLRPQNIDLLIDFQAVSGQASGLLPQLIRAAIMVLPHSGEWRSLSVAASSFPATLSGFRQNDWNPQPRTEWIAWRSVVTGKTQPKRLPTYSDYCVGDPSIPFEQRYSYAVNLRYAADDNFFVWRGMMASRHERGNSQIYDICADLVGRHEYSGSTFSMGDQQIRHRAASLGSPGGPGDWRKWATSHYLELVVAQLASLPGV